MEGKPNRQKNREGERNTMRKDAMEYESKKYRPKSLDLHATKITTTQKR